MLPKIKIKNVEFTSNGCNEVTRYQVLLCYDDVDEFMFPSNAKLSKIYLLNQSNKDLEEVLEDKKKEVKKQEKDYKDFLKAIKIV